MTEALPTEDQTACVQDRAGHMRNEITQVLSDMRSAITEQLERIMEAVIVAHA